MLLNCCVGEDSWESLGLQEIQPVNPKGDQSWVFIGRTDIEAETPIFWPPDVKNWLIGKDRDAGRYWGQEEMGTTEDEMVGWHHWLNGHGFGWTPGVGDRQGGLACCSSWGHKELDTTEWLNWTGLTELSWMECYFLVSCLFPLLAHWCNNWHTSSHLVNYYCSHMPGMTEQKDRYPIFPIFLFMKTVYHILFYLCSCMSNCSYYSSL